MTPRQSLVAHLKQCHGIHVARGTHKHWTVEHKVHHDGHVLPHVHAATKGYVDGSDLVTVSLRLIRPKNPSSTKAEERNWTLQIAGHKPHMVQFVRLYSTFDADHAGAVIAAENWLGWGKGQAVWTPINQTGNFEVKHAE